jgi:5-methylcytosine-specific restriction endonuclease McrA
MSRKLPPRDLAEAILIEQRGCCLYCLLPLDGWIYLGVNSIDLTLNWDHMKPYVYLQDNPDDNWAAACQICNSIKNDLHFVTLEETGQQRISTRLRDDADENAPYGYHADGLPRRSNGGRRRKSQA